MGWWVWRGMGWGQCPLGGTAAPPWAPLQPLRARGVELVYSLEFLVALEGDRDWPGSGLSPVPGVAAGRGAGHPAGRMRALSPRPLPRHTTSSFTRTHTDPRVHSRSHSEGTNYTPTYRFLTTHSYTRSHTGSRTRLLIVTWTLISTSHTPRSVTHTHTHAQTLSLPALPVSAMCLTHAGRPGAAVCAVGLM